MEIVIINGTGGSGKDSFVEAVGRNIQGKCYNYSTVDFVKYVAIHAGWRQDKTPENRKFLSDLKRLLTEWDDIPYKKTVMAIHSNTMDAVEQGVLRNSIMFIHCREPEEIARLVENWGAHSLLVTRAAADEVEQSNDSDRNVRNYEYDTIVENNGTLAELEDSARTYLREVLHLI